MGRGSRLKASMVSVMDSKPSSLSPQASFVSCLSCYYCDCVSFDETDVNTYAAHLRDSHSITRNVESLVALTLKEQQSRPEVVTPPAPTAVVQPPVFNLPTTEMTMDWMDDDVGGVMVEDEELEEESKEGKADVAASTNESSKENLTNDSVNDDAVPDEKKDASPQKKILLQLKKKSRLPLMSQRPRRKNPKGRIRRKETIQRRQKTNQMTGQL